MAFPASLPSYTITAGAETANGAAGGLGLSGLLNAFEVDITALGAKVGTGASTPVANTLLYATGTGTSAWQGLTSAQMAAIISDETGSGALVFGTSPTIVTPTIASFTNAQHSHTNAAGGGTLNGGSAIQAGTITYAALLTTIFSGQNATYTNTGTAGGSITWLNLGGIKIAFGRNVTTNAASWLVVDLLPVGFSTVPVITASGQGEAVSSPSAGAASGWIELASKSSPAGGIPELGGFSLLARTSTGANANPLVNFIAIGT